MASLFALLFVLGGALAILGSWAWLTFTAPGPLKDKKVFEIPKALDRTQIAMTLQDQGIITDARVFSAAAAVNALRGGKLRHGEYEFPANATMEDVLSMITAGRFLTYKVTIPEGWTTQMVVARLNEQKELQGDVTTVPAEGAILPDTYVFRRGMTRQKLLDDMQAAQTKLLDILWQNRPASTKLASPQELVTLASIVEKETGIAEERPQVASVFLNRLDQKMRLQSDPTIIYGIVGGKGKLDRHLTKADIDTPTPYNTYTIAGLPPGPIANPGRAALEAVLNPAQTKYLYFVADGTGGHAFSTTLDEHNANVKKWRGQQGNDSTTPETTAQPKDQASKDPAKTPDSPVPAPAPADTATPADPTIPAPDAVPPEPAIDQAATKPQTAKPGSTVTVNGKQVPIPIPKKPKK
ncbi:MAG: endolytic transglycosylase MltG [Alphaproteobacteria bacterium]|nr:endolytic transglycosylase MltG [Alphaproteobacteria bacterium]